MAVCKPITSYRRITELEKYFLDDVRRSQIKLGCGTFGVVEDLIVGHTTCVGKLIHKSLIDDDINEQSRRFSFACELLSNSQSCHPNIVPLMGLCTFDETVYPVLVMERVDESLESIVTTFKSVIPLPLILHVLKDVTKGLVFIHNHDPPIIHRNLTARNILISRTTMIAKIADIGDALIVHPEEFLSTLLHSPAIIPYMPPEVIYRKPNHSCMLDMFSFGHLVLNSIIQKFPLAKDLKEPTYTDVETRESKARSEVERREVFVKMLYSKLTRDHKLTQMIIQCLQDMPGKRPPAVKVLETIADVFVDEDPYRGDVDLVKLLNMSDCDQQPFDATGMVAAGGEDFLKHRVMEIKNGAPVVLDIFRYHGRLKRKQDWRRQMFQIKDGFLKYFKSNPIDGSHDELDLTSVVCVNACPPRDNDSLFYFEIHYTGRKGSPWLLRAYTQDDRACWMEAIHPGSSAFFRFPASSDYEKISFDAIYDEPEIAVSQYLQMKGSHHPAAASKSNKKTEDAPSKEPIQVCPPPEIPKSLSAQTLETCVLPKETIPDVTVMGGPQETENELYNLDPNKAQLLMLLQMQQMVQKMEEYERTQMLQKGANLPFAHTHSQKVSQVSDIKGSSKKTDQSTTHKKITREILRSETSSHSEQPLSGDAPPRKRPQSEPCPQYKPVLHLSNLEKSTFSQSCDGLSSDSVLTVSSYPTPGECKKPANQRRQEKMSHQDILSALSKTISPKIATHLVTDDSIYASGKRPEWTKAKTQSSSTELSLDDIHRNALWIPRSSLQNLKEIGKGQYGTVYKGEYRRLDSPMHFVAIKTIRQHESEKEQFLSEMKVMSNMIHPNIVRLFGLVQQEQPWIVLEYLPNGDLNTFLKKKTQPLNKLVKFMLDVATGMHYISERGLVHRDLAARNVMVSKDEICKVGDFGLLRKIPKDATVYRAKSEFPFPLRWMAPESYQKKEFSPASDVWSFGIVMWEMYNPNKLPYDDMNDLECAIHVSQGTTLTIPKPYPETVVKIMKACWQQDPSKRPSFMLCAALLTDVYLHFQQE